MRRWERVEEVEVATTVGEMAAAAKVAVSGSKG